MNYDVDYFIKKFEAIPEELWHIGQFHNNDKTKFCAAGHCGGGQRLSKECDCLVDLFSNSIFTLGVTEINDGEDYLYPQPTPKQRVLAALYDLKANQAVKQAEDIINSPAQLITQ